MLADALRVSAGTLTVVRVGPLVTVDRRRAGAAMLLAPVAVLPLGAAVAVIAAVGTAVTLPTLVTGVLAVAVLALGSRALHLDGLSDTVDGLTASYDRERSLAVMRTGTSGPAGTAALVLVLGVQAASLAGILAGASWRAAVLAGAAVCISRVALAACCARGVPAARADGLGTSFAGTVPRGAVAGLWALAAVSLAALGGWAGLPWWQGGVAVLAAGAVVAALLRRATTRLGGVTGDVLGAATELALAALLVVLT